MICLGLDIGSTTIKGAVLDLQRREVRSIVKTAFPQPLRGLPAGNFEVDPNAILAVAERMLTNLLQKAPEAEAIFCSGQMGGVIVVDEAGAALTNYLSWRDQRTLQSLGPAGTTLDAIRARWTGSELADLGQELQAGSAMSLLFWLAQQDRLPPRAMPATVADFVIGQLCHTAPQMDPTQAIGLLDLNLRTWHSQALHSLGLGHLRWPQLTETRNPVGHLSAGGRQIPCHASFGDQQTALKGAGVTRQELSINISTGSQVSRRTAKFEPGPYQTRYYFDGDFLNTITHLPAGRSLDVLFDLLTELARAEDLALKKAWQFIARSAANANGGGLNIDLTFFAGPLGERGRLEGITTENLTVGNLFHAAFCNMADNYACCADRLCPERVGLGLALSGGLTRSVPILRQLIQERFAMPLRESVVAEETLLGLLEIAREVYLPG
jgi:sugar (pentulose or hexulose) kinase